MNRGMQLHDLRENWTPPDGLGYSSLRPVCLTGGGIALLVAAALLLIGAAVAGVALGSQATRQSDASRQLQEKGSTTDAVIARVWRTRGEGKQPQRAWVAYRFTSAGREYEARAETPRRIWKDLEAGGTLPVRFVPSNPAVNHPRGFAFQNVPGDPLIPFSSSSCIGINLDFMIILYWTVLHRIPSAARVIMATRDTPNGKASECGAGTLRTAGP